MNRLELEILRAVGMRNGFTINDLRQAFHNHPDHIDLSMAWSSLLRSGMVVEGMFPQQGVSGAYHAGFHWLVTPRGQEALRNAQTQPAPEDSEGFMSLLRKDPHLHEFVNTTVGEAIRAYNQGWPVACIMCLFAGMEHVVRDVDSCTQQPKDQMTNISAVFNSLDQRMNNRKQVPAVQAFLSTTFAATRDARNSASHRGGSPDLATLRILLLQFLSWYEGARQLRDNPLV